MKISATLCDFMRINAILCASMQFNEKQCDFYVLVTRSHTFALLVAGKMCVVGPQAPLVGPHHLALLAFGSTVSCSARPTVAAATH